HPHSRPRHPRTRTMVPLLLLLLATAHGLEKIQYKPELAVSNLEGRTTASTFVLEQPRCIFKNYSDTEIWLVVAIPSAIPDFNNSLAPGSPERAFQKFPESAHAYMTLGTTFMNYPCNRTPGEITVLRVGSETSCAKDMSRPTCNGPLPGPGPYQVKFLAFNSLTVPLAETEWSEPITLRTGSAAGTLMKSRHSAGMIALTSILSILLAILLAILVAMLVSCGSDTCGSSGTFSKPDMVSVQRYNTHHVYDQPAAQL
ncbi:UPK3B protein, partial [Alcedo cyanopectus]|nr:UPK3B protein [Ceyx cyanopectus]